jgi:hypothetical protein
MVLLILVLPVIDAYLSKKYNSPEQANLVTARGCVLFLVMGTTVIGLASHSAGVFVGE